MLDRDAIGQAAALSGDAPILVAFSGGGDSTALLHLLCEARGPERLRAIVIDHALRAGAAEDAARAKAAAERLGVVAQVRRLDWPEGPNSAQQAARDRRYAALCAAAHEAGARVIALGHTRDDQAETVLLRAARGSGWRGLAGMRAFAPAPLWPDGRGLRVTRPLLGVRRAALREVLRARRAEWIEDPANENERYGRVRARRRLAELEGDGLDPMRLAAVAEALAPHAAALDRAAWALIENAVTFEADRVRIARAAWRGEAAARHRALAALIAAAAGQARAPEGERLAALEAAARTAAFKAATLAGAELRAEGACLVLTRDAGALAGRADGAPAPAPLPLPPGAACVWDGRVALTAGEAGWAVAAGPPPALVRGQTRLPLAAASPLWLLEAHVRHRLGVD